MNNQKREIIQSQSILLCIICQLNYCHNQFFLVIKFSSSLILLNFFFFFYNVLFNMLVFIISSII